MSVARVSIVIPTRNGAATLPAVLHAVWQQKFAGGVEVIAVDSGSTDGTVDLLKDRVDRLITIPPDTFNHGLTRNLGVESATSELVVMLVQDAVPQSEHWLNALIAPFRVNPVVAGTFARQVPRDDASQLTRRYLARWVAATTTPFESALGGQSEFDGLTPAERYRRCAFDNVCSCLRRSVWQDHPFRETAVAEDLEWAKEVLLAGRRIAFAPDAVVVHSHERPVRYEYRRTLKAHERLTALFDLQTIPSVPLLARAIVASAASHLWCELATPERLPRALALAVAWPLGQYVGARRPAPPTPTGPGITG